MASGPEGDPPVPSAMPINVLSPSLIAGLFPRPTGGGIDFSVFGAQGNGQVYSAANAGAALKQAEANEEKLLASLRKDPVIQRELARYEKVAKAAASIDDVMKDPIARKVFLTANGLASQVDYVGLATRALNSDLTDEKSLANQLAGTNAAWRETVLAYNFHALGVTIIQTTNALRDIADNYVAEKRLDRLDEQLPGLGSAILFKRVAASLDTSTKILGSGIGREVITIALGLPSQLAVQSIEAQEKAIEQRLDPKKLSEPAYVDRLVQRYLIALNGGSGGVVA